MAKNILIFSLVYYPNYVGGAENAVKEITDRISSLKYQFHMITLKRGRTEKKEELIGNITVHRIGYPYSSDDVVTRGGFILLFNKILFPFLAFFEARKLQKKYSFEAQWSLMANYAGFAAYFFKINYPSIPFILSLQEGDSEKHLRFRWGGLISLSWKLTLQKADFLVAISSYLLERAKKIGYTGKGFVIPNGVNVELFSKIIREEEIALLKEKLQKKERDIFLVSTSRLVHKNAVDDIIRSLVYLPSNFYFLNFGFGPDKNNLESLATSLHVEKRVHLLDFPGISQLPPYLKACDIFVRPSRSEGMGNSFIEAMAAGIPVIATPVGGITDFLKDRETGLFCEVNNPNSIAEKALEYTKNTELSTQIIINARSMVKEKYDWNIIAKEMEIKVFSII